MLILGLYLGADMLVCSYTEVPNPVINEEGLKKII